MKKYIVFLCVIICLLGLVACSAQTSDNTHRNDNLVNLDEEAKKTMYFFIGISFIRYGLQF